MTYQGVTLASRCEYLNHLYSFRIYLDEVPQNFIRQIKREYKVLKENLRLPKSRCLLCCPYRQLGSGGEHFSFWFWFGYKNFLLHENASGKIFQKRNHNSKVEYERNKSKKIFKMCAHTFNLCSKTFVNRLFGNVFAQKGNSEILEYG
jgi:hypothetical protein